MLIFCITKEQLNQLGKIKYPQWPVMFGLKK